VRIRGHFQRSTEGDYSKEIAGDPLSRATLCYFAAIETVIAIKAIKK